jgi:hypothetical protein
MTGRLNLRLPQELLMKLRREAIMRQVDVADVAREIIGKAIRLNARPDVRAVVEQIMDIVHHTTRSVERFDDEARPVGRDTVPDYDGMKHKIAALLDAGNEARL